MAKKRRRRRAAVATEAPVEVAKREGPEAAANSATPGKTERRRGANVTDKQEASTAVHAPGPADSGKETTDREGKKPKLNKQKRNKKDQSPCAPASDADAAATGKSGDDSTHGVGVLGEAGVSMDPRNGDDPDCPEVNIGEKGTQERKEPKCRKRKEKNMQQLSPSAVSDDNAVEVDKSRTDSKDVPGDDKSKTIRSPRNEEDPGFSAVKIAGQEIPEREKPRLKKRKNSKQERFPSAVMDADTVVLGTSENDCTHGKCVPGVADIGMSSRNGEDQDCPEVNIAEKGTNERKKRKPKKWKKKKEGSSDVVLDAGAAVADESENGCMDGDGVPQNFEASIFPRNGEDPHCPAVNNAEKEVPEMYKPKRKKQKKNNQEQSPAVLDAGGVVVDISGHDSTTVGAPSDGADGIMSPRIGEGPEYPKSNATDDLLEGNKVNKDHPQKSKLKKQMKNKHEQSPCAVPDTCAVVEDKSGKSYIDGKGSLGDTEICTSPRNGKDHDCPEVNVANDLVDGKNGNNDNSQKLKNKKRKRKKRARVTVTETPPVGDVSSDERRDVCRTGYMKIRDKSDIISMTSTSGENHKTNVRDIYSPGGSLVRFQRKQLLILDLNGILADINTDHDVAHLADGRVRGKNVFKRPYFDDFLRFCFQNFELGIWSSRMKVNVDAVVDILMKDLRRHLVFCWDMSKCTTTKASTLENDHKPLVLKELKKLWNKEDPDLPWEQGEFSPSNTLLVDDSPYKALRNPPYTAIFPQPYSYHNGEDKSLGPGGDLRVYLENIAAADDVQLYVQEHPFGQSSITESDPNWDFYANIHYRLDRLERS